MAEILIEFAHLLQRADGRSYTARACGREREDGKWEGWIEFSPDDSGDVLRSPRETTQPNRQDLAYWASGLSAAYLEGALARAQDASRRSDRAVGAPPPVGVAPASGRPDGDRAGPTPVQGHAMLDPFEVYSHSGETILRQELAALSAGRLRDLIAAFRLHADGPEAVERAALAELIVAAVRRHDD
jgi:hypothetical protein